MATLRTGSHLLHFLLGVLLLSPGGGVISLELLPSASRVVLEGSAAYSVVCSGWSHVTWTLPAQVEGGMVEGVAVDDQGSSSVLHITNTTWRQSGRYTCTEDDSEQNRTLDLFVPGSGPSEWFVPGSDAVVMRRSLAAVIPCVVSDPSLSVSLWERSGSDRTPVSPVHFEPLQGFTARLNDSSYICSAAQGHQEVLSQVYYVFSIIDPGELDVELSSSGVVLMKGDHLTVNCTVSKSENIYFTWDYPRQHTTGAEGVEPLTEFLSNQIRSFINISETTPDDSGLYVCSVYESTQKRTLEKSLNITVLSQSFLSVSPSDPVTFLALVHHTVELQIHIRAFPPPNVTWTSPDITTASASATTSMLSHTRFVSVLTLEKVQLNQTGSYIATISNDDDIKEIRFTLEVKAPPRIRSLLEKGVASVQCVSEGAPPPQLRWFTCPSEHRCSNGSGGWRNLSESEGASVKENITENQGLTTVQSILTLKSLASVSAVRCESKNTAGRRAWDLRLVSTSLLSQVKVLAAVLVLVVLAVVFFILLILLWRKKPRVGVGWMMVDSVSADGLQVQYSDPSELPYPLDWEIPRGQLQLGPVVSSGTFGRIVEASVSDLFAANSSTKATVTTSTGGAALQTLLSDLKILIHVGPHLNLLNLLGACTRDGPLMVVSEWCRHGDLSSYLRKHKHTCVTDHAHNKRESDGYMDMNSEDCQYVAMKRLCSDQQECEILHNTSTTEQQGALCDSEDLSLSDLLSFSFQMASAMDFLSARNVVHRDLAARNVLVSEGKVLKLCDFYLGRNLNQDYVYKQNSWLPVKWMSPESIFLCVYTVQSDVWSYGVLLWEIFSLGETPYPDVPVRQFYSNLKNGERLNKPELAPPELFDLMSRCWDSSPESRPSFSSLLDSVEKMLPQNYHQRYGALTEQFHSDLPQTRTRTEPGLNQTRTRTEPGLNQTRTRTEPGLNPDSSVPEVMVHLSGADPHMTSPSHSDDITTESEVTVETRGESTLDADAVTRPDLKQDVTSSEPEESCF